MDDCELAQAMVVIVPGVQITGTEPHSFEAVTVMLQTGSVVVLQPNDPPAGQLEARITGAVTTCQV